MIREKDQNGLVASVLLAIFLGMLLLAVGGFAIWAFGSRQDYKNNVDDKIAAAVASAKDKQQQELKKQFDEQSKLPTKTYKGPLSAGSVSFNYPKTWSAFIDESDDGKSVKGYFYPDFVPAADSTAYALRFELGDDNYDSVISGFEGQIKNGALVARAYVPPSMKKAPNVQTGTKLDGSISNERQGSMVVIKVRDKTLKIYTESPVFIKDFDKFVLASLKFIP